MKRFFALLIVLLVLSTIAIYVLIPATLKIAALTIVPTNSEATFRVISNSANWLKWTNGQPPVKTDSNNIGAFTNDTYTFYIKEVLHNAARIKVTQGSLKTNSLFTILPITKDSSVMMWESEISTGLNPILKIQRYRQALAFKKSISGILDKLKQFLEKKENLYGYNFHVASTTDTLLVAYRSGSPTYPDTKTLYNDIFKLQQYVNNKGGKQIGPPMLNITKQDDNTYDYMLALPVDKKINAAPPFLYRRLVAGNFLITAVKGGEYTVNDALSMMQLYINDYGKTSMAIPFRRLITDRLSQPDTSQWKTEIYFPVIR
ncbi:MAG: GyrI-like domain-containing protein [Chitinophagaceae bacterium]|nr:GyrI-like domain-containing protein [Chitinophagaceae bacterium]